MRSLATLAVGSVLSLLTACGSGGDSPRSGKAVGEACATETECARGLVCFQAACAASYAPSAGCALPGSPRIVHGDPIQAPEPPPDVCVTTVRDPVPPGEFVDLGEHAVGGTLSFEVPPGTSSLTFVSQDIGDTAVREIFFQGLRLPNTVVPTNVRLPGGALFFSDTAALPRDARGYDDVTGVLAYYAGFTAVSGSFTIPNTAAALDLVRTTGEVPPGRWTLTVNDWATECLGISGCNGGSTSGRYRVHAHARPGPLASTGTLDLEVYLVTDPAGPLPDAAAAVAHPQVTRWVQKLSEQFALAGICLGTVTFRELPRWARDRFAPAGQVDISGAGLGLPPAQTPPGCDDLSQLFTVAVAQSRAVHLFLADELVDRDAQGPLTVLGIDGSIPGPSGVPGTVNGGAIVGISGWFGEGACSGASGPPWSCGTDVLAYVAAHEAGHWLGLYHTTEAFGTTFDPLSDTGRCPCLACAPSGERTFCAERGAPDPTFVEADFCSGTSTPVTEIAARAVPSLACTGAHNLMFWQFDPRFARGDVSRQQGEVMRLNPAVR